MPTTSKPCSTSSAAVTELSTPPDMATTIRQSRGGFGRSSGLWGGMGRQYKPSPAGRNGAVGCAPSAIHHVAGRRWQADREAIELLAHDNLATKAGGLGQAEGEIQHVLLVLAGAFQQLIPF